MAEERKLTAKSIEADKSKLAHYADEERRWAAYRDQVEAARENLRLQVQGECKAAYDALLNQATDEYRKELERLTQDILKKQADFSGLQGQFTEKETQNKALAADLEKAKETEIGRAHV